MVWENCTDFGKLILAQSRLINHLRPSKPVSRVLYSESLRSGDHLSSPDVTIRVKRPTRGLWPGVLLALLFGLAPDGVYPADWSPSRW